MINEKIAIVVDSGSDVPEEMIQKHKIYRLPLKVIYHDKEYLDGVNITTNEVFDRIKDEIPTTSLPSPELISDVFRQIAQDGYTHVIAITISSALSGTYNIVKLLGEENEDLEVFALDSRNISIGSGCLAMNAGEYIRTGVHFKEICRRLERDRNNSKIFFTLSTLDYLRKGGRIGKVAGFVGELLDLKPIITCDTEGYYETVSKARGWKRALDETINYAKQLAEKSKSYNVFFVYGKVTDELKSLTTKLKQLFTFLDAKNYFELQASPALGVHTGPGLFGVGIQVVDA